VGAPRLICFIPSKEQTNENHDYARERAWLVGSLVRRSALASFRRRRLGFHLCSPWTLFGNRLARRTGQQLDRDARQTIVSESLFILDNSAAPALSAFRRREHHQLDEGLEIALLHVAILFNVFGNLDRAVFP
jgi:hypothetical protein